MSTAGNSSVCDQACDVLLERLPDLKRFILTEGVEKGTVKGCGSYAEVYDGTLSVSCTEKKKIAIKRIRVILYKETDGFVKAFEREVNIWGQLDHVNVIPFLGITMVDNGPALVSEWMDNGTMSEYLSKNPSINKLEMVQEVAAGLSYLHRSGIVHADLKGDNILVSSDGKPKITDFGISRIVINSMTIAGPTAVKGNTRWMAPELFSMDESVSEHPAHTKQTDVWAFGMVVYEVLSGQVPYFSIRNEVQVMMAVATGKLPEQPFTDEQSDECARYLWSCCLQCWREVPGTRPKSSELEVSLLSVDNAPASHDPPTLSLLDFGTYKTRDDQRKSLYQPHDLATPPSPINSLPMGPSVIAQTKNIVLPLYMSLGNLIPSSIGPHRTRKGVPGSHRGTRSVDLTSLARDQSDSDPFSSLDDFGPGAQYPLPNSGSGETPSMGVHRRAISDGGVRRPSHAYVPVLYQSPHRYSTYSRSDPPLPGAVSRNGTIAGAHGIDIPAQGQSFNATVGSPGASAEASQTRRRAEATFVCPVPGCGSSFTRHFNLKGHLRSHYEEKPFKCKSPGCGKSFARQHDCEQHEELHLNVRSVVCDGCQKKFTRMDALDRHLRSEAGAKCASRQTYLTSEESNALGTNVGNIKHSSVSTGRQDFPPVWPRDDLHQLYSKPLSTAESLPKITSVV